MLYRIFYLSFITLRSLIKDRVFIVIFSGSVLFLIVPIFSSLSMRQVQEVSITLCLSLHSFLLFVLSIFGGISTIWRDIERKFVYNFLSYPITRGEYIWGRYLGCVLLVFMVSILNFLLSFVAIYISSKLYKSELVLNWCNISTGFAFVVLKYLLLMAFSFLFATFSTSFFVPFFLTIAIFIVGNCSQGIYDYIITDYGQKYSALFKFIIKMIYYLMPNFSSFDFTVYAAYSLPLNNNDIVYVLIYFFLYFFIIMSLSSFVFSKRDLS